MSQAIKAIAHPTDLSAASREAFAHALRLALEYRCRLDLLHVMPPEHDREPAAFPRVRETLVQWGLLRPGAAPADVHKTLGVEICKIEIQHRDPLQGVTGYLQSHRPSLIVMATHGGQGLKRFLSESVSQGIAQSVLVPALFLGPNCRPFVNSKTGNLHLKNTVIPVARDPSPERALHLYRTLFGNFGLAEHLIHVGDSPFTLAGENVAPLQGPAVDTIIAAANTYLADLLVMPTAGRQGFLDALRGSTTEQVLRRAPCALLSLPV